jgi:hypothetical protein
MDVQFGPRSATPLLRPAFLLRSLVWFRTATILVLLTLAAVAISGCSTEDERAAARHATLAAAGQDAEDEGLFHTEVRFSWRTAGTRYRSVTEPVFAVRDDSRIKADVVLNNIRPGRTYSVHLAWIRPDGHELFRRYAEVTRHEIGLPPGVAPDSSGALPAQLLAGWQRRFGPEEGQALAEQLAAAPEAPVAVNEVVYKKAIDLHFAQRRVEVGADDDVGLDSRFDISRERQRQLGQYQLRVYLDRRLLQEVPFQVHDDG